MFSPLLRWMEKAIKTAPARLFFPISTAPPLRLSLKGEERGSEVMRLVVLLLCNSITQITFAFDSIQSILK